MRLTIIDKDTQECTIVEIMVFEWDGKSEHFTIFCADSDYAEIRLTSPLLIKSVINDLQTLGHAEIQGVIVWKEDIEE